MNEYEENYQELSAEEQAQINRQEAIDQGRDPDEPHPSQFSDYDQYVQAVADHRIQRKLAQYEQRRAEQHVAENPQTLIEAATRKGLTDALQQDRQAMAQAQAQAQQTLTPFPDDPKGGDREFWTTKSMNAGKEALKAKEAGDIQTFHDWRQRQRQYEAEIEKLGPTPEQEYVETLRDHEVEQAMKLLTDPDHANDAIWKHPRFQEDAPIAVIKANQRAKTTLRLPLETSRHGTLLPCEPRNMAVIELKPNEMARFKAALDSLNPKEKEDPDAVLRKSWAILHRYGYSPLAKRVMESKPGKEAEGEETHPDRMSWQEFVAWREATEAKKRGIKKGFVFPQKRGGRE